MNEDKKQEPVACQHKRYSIDVHEQIGNCLDCGAEGRMRFIVGTPQSFTYEQVKAHIQVALLSSQPVVKESLTTEPVAWINFCAFTGKMTVDFDWSGELASIPLFKKEQL